jgi:hypothetical protein
VQFIETDSVKADSTLSFRELLERKPRSCRECSQGEKKGSKGAVRKAAKEL